MAHTSHAGHSTHLALLYVQGRMAPLGAVVFCTIMGTAGMSIIAEVGGVKVYTVGQYREKP